MNTIADLNIADCGQVNEPLGGCNLRAAVNYARKHGHAGVQLTCHGIKVIVLANGEHTHVAPAGKAPAPFIRTNVPRTPRNDSAQP